MVSKNNRYLKDVLQADKAQHWSLRKLGIGVTSVLLGTTFYLGGNTVAHADTTAPATAPADNGGQVATVSPAESGNTTVLKASASTAPSQSAAPQSVATSTTPQSATVAQSANNAVSQSPATGGSTTTPNNARMLLANQAKTTNSSSLELSTSASPVISKTNDVMIKAKATSVIPKGQINKSVVNQSPTVVNNNTNSVNEEIPVVKNTKIEFTNGNDAIPDNEKVSMNAPFPVGLQGSFQFAPTGNGKYIQVKKGQTYTIAQLKQISNNGKQIPIVNFGDNCYVTYNGQQVGTLSYDNNAIKFNAISDFNGIGNIDIKFHSGINMISVNGVSSGETDKHIFKTDNGSNYITTVNLIDTSNHQIKQYKFEFVRDQFPELSKTVESLGPVLRHESANLHYFAGRSIINDNILNQLQASKG